MAIVVTASLSGSHADNVLAPMAPVGAPIQKTPGDADVAAIMYELRLLDVDRGGVSAVIG
jgi:hypothetical protein